MGALCFVRSIFSLQMLREPMLVIISPEFLSTVKSCLLRFVWGNVEALLLPRGDISCSFTYSKAGMEIESLK